MQIPKHCVKSACFGTISVHQANISKPLPPQKNDPGHACGNEAIWGDTDISLLKTYEVYLILQTYHMKIHIDPYSENMETDMVVNLLWAVQITGKTISASLRVRTV